MGQFKPMVKMMTNEPSVILKLKKGGKVASKVEEMCHKPMDSSSFESESGKAPKKPSIMSRVKAMNPNQYKKGGKIAHKQYGGAMGNPAVMPAGAAPAAPMQAMGRADLAQMDDAARNARAMQVRKALAGMKKGGSTSDCAKLEKELKHHESMPMGKVHKKASGGTIEGNVGQYAKTKMVTAHANKSKGSTGEVTEGKPGGYATGGTIPADSNKGGKDYAKTVMHTATKDDANGTGEVRMSNAGGFKKGGTIEGGNWENRPANTAKKGVTGTTTGEVKKGNGGGYKQGGMASKKAYATGGDVDMGQADRTLRQSSRGDGKRTYNVVNKSGKVVSSHGSQSDAMRGAMKDFDNLSVKRKYASGGNVVDDGKAVKMPKHFVSQPVANSLQSGTFKRGGKVK
jgi:hypothetical protein